MNRFPPGKMTGSPRKVGEASRQETRFPFHLSSLKPSPLHPRPPLAPTGSPGNVYCNPCGSARKKPHLIPRRPLHAQRPGQPFSATLPSWPPPSGRSPISLLLYVETHRDEAAS